MRCKIRETNSGYVINLSEKGKKMKFFLKDCSHTLESHIPNILSKGNYKIGKPFGNDIYPIYIKEEINPSLPKHNYKTMAIWNYYRELVRKNETPRNIKKYANEMRSKLLSIGIDALYTYVQKEKEESYVSLLAF